VRNHGILFSCFRFCSFLFCGGEGQDFHRGRIKKNFGVRVSATAERHECCLRVCLCARASTSLCASLPFHQLGYKQRNACPKRPLFLSFERNRCVEETCIVMFRGNRRSLFVCLFVSRLPSKSNWMMCVCVFVCCNFTQELNTTGPRIRPRSVLS